MNNKPSILFINMASGFGGGEFQTEQLMTALPEYQVFFFGRKKSDLTKQLNHHAIKSLSFFQMLKLVLNTKNLIVHAQDGRGVHIAGFLKWLTKCPVVITRHVVKPFRHKSSLHSYKKADALVGVSQKISAILSPLNPNTHTIYGCIKPLKENLEFEQRYFSNQKADLTIVQIGNLQPVKNIELTIELAKNNPQVQFYIVGSGVLEDSLKTQAKDLDNVYFIPFTDYIGSVFKQADLQILPSHSEGLGGVILEGYQYQIPTIAHAVGGIPEIIEDGKTGFLIHNNELNAYQAVLNNLLQDKTQLSSMKTSIADYLVRNPFSQKSMVDSYKRLYQSIFDNLSSNK